jgi:hypothetical protein
MSNRRKLKRRSKACPDCNGVIEVIRGQLDGDKIIRKATVRIVHRSSCPKWRQKAREHGAHPDITVLVHETEKVILTEETEPAGPSWGGFDDSLRLPQGF